MGLPFHQSTLNALIQQANKTESCIRGGGSRQSGKIWTVPLHKKGSLYVRNVGNSLLRKSPTVANPIIKVKEKLQSRQDDTRP